MSLAETIRAQARENQTQDGKAQSQRYQLTRPASPSTLSAAMHRLGQSLREWGYGLGLYRWRLSGRHPVQLLASPDDPAPGNGTLGRKILGGELCFENETIQINEDIWPALHGKTRAFLTHAHRFHFLEDLAQVGDQTTAREAAEYLTRQWLEDYTHFDPFVWQADILARRQISWCVHAPLILSSKDLVYKSSLLLVMAHQARHLLRVFKDSSQGLGQIYAGTALILSGLILPGGQHWQQKGEGLLGACLQGFIHADGGPKTHSTADAIKIMQQLIILRSAYREVNLEQPNWLQSTLDKLGPFVRAMRFMGGSIAAFGGTSSQGGTAMEIQNGTDAILHAAEAAGKAMESLPKTGYQRLDAGRSSLIMDVAPPPPVYLSAKAGASTGAFEFADGPSKIIVSMGPAGSRTDMPDLAPLSRMTAAFSAHVVSNRNASPFDQRGLIGKGVTTTDFTRTRYDHGGQEISLTHDGYAKRCGVSVERRLFLSEDGRTLKAFEKWGAVNPRKAKLQTATIRLHLHPDVRADKLDDGRIRLQTPSGIWLFSHIGGTCALEASLYIQTPDQIAQTQQIVIEAGSDQLLTDGLRWRLSKEQISV